MFLYNISKAEQKIWSGTYFLKKIKFDRFWGPKVANFLKYLFLEILFDNLLGLSWWHYTQTKLQK